MRMKPFKPMLGKTLDNLDDINYPVLVSKKLDGIRCIFKDGEMLSRSLKPIPNKQLQKKFEHLKYNNIILDGELYSHDLTFQEIASIVMSFDKDVPESLEFHCFDYLDNIDEVFENRCKEYKHFNVVPVKQILINNKEELEQTFQNFLQEGYEGAIIRDPNSKYKFGRSTLKEAGLLKMKCFKTFDAKIIDVFERMENLNESFKNELGQSTKRNTKDDKKSTGIAGGFVVEWEGQTLKITLTGKESFREQIWSSKDEYIGKWVEFKGMEIGAKDVPRHPCFVRFRPDMA